MQSDRFILWAILEIGTRDGAFLPTFRLDKPFKPSMSVLGRCSQTARKPQERALFAVFFYKTELTIWIGLKP